MKLLRWGKPGEEKPGIMDEMGIIRDLSDHQADIDPAALTPERLKRLKQLNLENLPKVDRTHRLGCPVAGIRNIFCIGLNYRAHAEEAGMEPPNEPILFSKATSALTGPSDQVIIPKDSQKTDWEVELGVIIGQETSHVSQEDALSHVAGYVVVNDVSEREFQIERGGQWIKGKSAPSFCPVGPWLVTADEVPNPQKLNLWLELNGEKLQNSSTGDMIFGVAEIISHISRFLTLLPGDLIATGTPQGVGMGFKPQKFLKPGDKMRLGVEGLGEQNQDVVAWSA